LIVVYPEHLEELFEQMKLLLEMHKPSSGPMVIVWDSIAGMCTKDGEARDAGNRKVGDVPLIMSEELKKVVPMLKKHRAALYAINQVRTKIGVMFGPDTTTPGGKAPKYYASQRLQIMGGKAVKNAKGEHIGKIITLLAVKNRFGSPWKKARVRLDYATGFNNLWSTIWHAKTQKLIKCRAEGFAGPSHDGLAAYNEALVALGWNTGTPHLTVLEDDPAGDDDAPDNTDDDPEDDPEDDDDF
jgi:RecA/RadA recombinase